MRRHIIGILALLLLLGGVIYWIWPPQDGFGRQMEAACWRLGPVLVMLWTAYPQLNYVPGWLWMIIPPILAMLAWKPRLFLVAIPVVLALAILKPRLGRPENSGNRAAAGSRRRD